MADMKRDRRRGPHRDSACRNCGWALDPYTACRCGATNPSVKLGDRIGGHSDPMADMGHVRNGVCLLCGSGELADGTHIRDDLDPCRGRPLADIAHEYRRVVAERDEYRAVLDGLRVEYLTVKASRDAEVERLREARLLALAELTGLDNANLDEHERACLRSAVRVLAS